MLAVDNLFCSQKLQVKEWDRKMYGKFCTGDAYIVLQVRLARKWRLAASCFTHEAVEPCTPALVALFARACVDPGPG